MTDPNAIIHQWIHDINHRNIEDLLSLYHPEAVLIPTFSNRILDIPVKIREYFEKLGRREDLSIALHANPQIRQTISNGICSFSGIYCWRFSVDEELLSFEARFSYLLDLNDPKPIRHHHSSQIPRMI